MSEKMRNVCQLSRLSWIFLDEIRQVNNRAAVNRTSVSNVSLMNTFALRAGEKKITVTNKHSKRYERTNIKNSKRP